MTPLLLPSWRMTAPAPQEVAAPEADVAKEMANPVPQKEATAQEKAAPVAQEEAAVPEEDVAQEEAVAQEKAAVVAREEDGLR